MKEPTQRRVTKCIVTLLIAGCLSFSSSIVFNSASVTDVDEPTNTQFFTGPQYEVKLLTSVETPRNQYSEAYAAHASDLGIPVVGVETVESTYENSTVEPALDRTKPIYEVYKDGYLVDVPVEWQWYIRDVATEYGFDEKIIFGMILKESCFNATCKGDGERSLGLAQINKYWIRTDNIPHFTENYRERNLLDPYDNILTLMELWCYARDAYDIDLSIEQGYKDLLYWHNTGQYIKNVNWKYSNRCLDYANELISLQ